MEVSEEVKKEIFKLISTPGIEVRDIPNKLNDKFHINLDYEELMQFLSDEYLKSNLDYGRRLCCRF